jgi:hypothetical protein
MLQTRDVALAVAVAVPVAVEEAVPVDVAGPVTRARVKRHLSLQTTHPSEPTGSGNSSGCWRCSSPNTTSSMSDYVAARVKQLREATVLMEEKKRLEEVKRKQCTIAQRQPHDKMLKMIKDSYSSCR